MEIRDFLDFQHNIITVEKLFMLGIFEELHNIYASSSAKLIEHLKQCSAPCTQGIDKMLNPYIGIIHFKTALGKFLEKHKELFFDEYPIYIGYEALKKSLLFEMFTYDIKTSSFVPKIISFNSFLKELDFMIVSRMVHINHSIGNEINLNSIYTSILNRFDSFVNSNASAIRNGLYSQNVIKEVRLCFGSVHCYRKNHCIKEVRANVLCSSLDEDIRVEKIYVHRCEDCERYFIEDNIFQIYQERYKNILVKILSEDDNLYYNKRKGYYFVFNGKERSLLNILGYNTRVSTKIRHMRLVSILACGQMKKYEIVNHLNYLLWHNENNPKHVRSLPVWKSDLEFLSDYSLDEHDEVYGAIIISAKSLGL